MKFSGTVDDRGHILTVLLTGGIGSGKSLAAKCFADRGVPVYDFDGRTKELYDSDPVLCRRVAEAVNPYTEEKVLTAEGKLDRRALARTVFSEPAALGALEAVVHPAVLADFKVWREDCKQPIVAAESAIALSKPLFADEFDKVILIIAPEDVRKGRVVARDGISGTEVEARMQTQFIQLPTEESAASPKIDYIIENNGEKGEFVVKIINALIEILKLVN